MSDSFTPPLRPYVVCATPRSGSNLLTASLSNFGFAGKPGEHFLPESVFAFMTRDHMRVGSFPDYVDQLMQTRCTPNGLFGTKIMWSHLVEFVNPTLSKHSDFESLNMFQRLDKVFHQPRYIWVTRRDKVRQAVSLYRATNTGDWVRRVGDAPVSAQPAVEFSFQSIENARLQVMTGDAGWKHLFAENHVTPLIIEYEDFMENYKPTMRQVLDFIEATPPPGFQIPAPPIEKQADNINEQFVQRYTHMQEREFQAAAQQAELQQQVQQLRSLPHPTIELALRNLYRTVIPYAIRVKIGQNWSKHRGTTNSQPSNV